MLKKHETNYNFNTNHPCWH